MVKKDEKTTKNKSNSESDKIIVKGARTHNLKNITVEMPRNKMVAITGLSGSGKSSLAFDTIFAEGQRRYIESFSIYARQFLGNLERPDVDRITGLSPVISIEQKTTNKNASFIAIRLFIFPINYPILFIKVPYYKAL